MVIKARRPLSTRRRVQENLDLENWGLQPRPPLSGAKSCMAGAVGDASTVDLDGMIKLQRVNPDRVVQRHSTNPGSHSDYGAGNNLSSVV
ncbi:hypothetical protein RRG08_033628 [Elysia crispata]|uniref:Uncharacterized protein n=1 Tax=Elysia crispata TaxID=231223 RepID=A0AAE0XQV4_9GAST|nr:hypothetical protein RRG08_033628 [Elysia crispata]